MFIEWYWYWFSGLWYVSVRVVSEFRVLIVDVVVMVVCCGMFVCEVIVVSLKLLMRL